MTQEVVMTTKQNTAARNVWSKELTRLLTHPDMRYITPERQASDVYVAAFQAAHYARLVDLSLVIGEDVMDALAGSSRPRLQNVIPFDLTRRGLFYALQERHYNEGDGIQHAEMWRNTVEEMMEVASTEERGHLQVIFDVLEEVIIALLPKERE